jgi:hypothetical protein
MQIHLWLKMKMSGKKGHRGPMANAMRCYISDSCWEAESLLEKT